VEGKESECRLVVKKGKVGVIHISITVRSFQAASGRVAQAGRRGGRAHGELGFGPRKTMLTNWSGQLEGAMTESPTSYKELPWKRGTKAIRVPGAQGKLKNLWQSEKTRLRGTVQGFYLQFQREKNRETERAVIRTMLRGLGMSAGVTVGKKA